MIICTLTDWVKLLLITLQKVLKYDSAQKVRDASH
jgi:hypothetical protein